MMDSPDRGPLRMLLSNPQDFTQDKSKKKNNTTVIVLSTFLPTNMCLQTTNTWIKNKYKKL